MISALVTSCHCQFMPMPMHASLVVDDDDDDDDGWES